MANKININQNQLYSAAGALDPRFIVDSVDKITSISNAYVGLEVSVIDSEENTIEKYRIKKINNLTKKPLPANQGGYELIQEPKDLKYSDETSLLDNNGKIDIDTLKLKNIPDLNPALGTGNYYVVSNNTPWGNNVLNTPFYNITGGILNIYTDISSNNDNTIGGFSLALITRYTQLQDKQLNILVFNINNSVDGYLSIDSAYKFKIPLITTSTDTSVNVEDGIESGAIISSESNRYLIRISLPSQIEQASDYRVVLSFSNLLDLSSKVDKVQNANGNLPKFDSNGNLVNSEISASSVLTSHQDISGKADKVNNATANDFAALDGNGNLIDSGKKSSDFATSASVSTIQGNYVKTTTSGVEPVMDSSFDSASDCVRFDESQTNSEQRKQLARKNIGALNINDLKTINNESLFGNGNITVRSAYEEWLAAKNTGSEQEFLASLKAQFGSFVPALYCTDTGHEGEPGDSNNNLITPDTTTLNYIYLVDNAATNPTAKTMWITTVSNNIEYDWTSIGDVQVDLTFGSGQAINDVKIKDLNGEEVQGTADVLSAEAGVELNESINSLTQKVTAKNLLNPSLIVSGKRVKSNGGLESVTASVYGVYAFIPVKPNTMYHISSLGDTPIYGTTSGYIGFYEMDNSSSVIQDTPTVDANTTSFTTPSNCHYICISFRYADLDEQQLEEGDSRTVYEEWFEPYRKIDSTKLTPIGHEVIGNGAVGTNNLIDRSVTMAKLQDTVLKTPKNLLNPALQIQGKRLSSSGGAQNVTAAYGIYDYIEVEPETTYHISNANGTTLYNTTSGYICFYSTNATTGFISSVDAKTTGFTTPEGCYYVRISFRYADLSDEPQLEVGTVRTAYEAWFEPRIVLDPSLMTIGVGAVGTEQLKDGCVTPSKLVNPLRDKVYARYDGLAAEDTALAFGQRLETALIYVTKNTRVVAYITGNIMGSVLVGINYGNDYGMCVEVTPSTLLIKKGDTFTLQNEYTHGLQLGGITTVVIDKTCTTTVQNKAVVRLVNDYGQIYEQEVTWPTIMGKAYVMNSNDSGTLGVRLALQLADLPKKIWMFGDSYVAAIQDLPKWTHYLMTWGYDQFLLDARPGENATEGLADFDVLLSTGAVPAYAVWLHGMNGGADQSGNVNSTWLEKTTAFLSRCDSFGIVPILSTIPTVPTHVHQALNAWIRSSGIRYIDVAASVEEGDGVTNRYWRGWGDVSTQLLNADEVHPTTLGAKVILARVLADFPEIMVR